MRWGWRESNPRRPSQNVTGPRFRLIYSLRGWYLPRYLSDRRVSVLYGSVTFQNDKSMVSSEVLCTNPFCDHLVRLVPQHNHHSIIFFCRDLVYEHFHVQSQQRISLGPFELQQCVFLGISFLTLQTSIINATGNPIDLLIMTRTA